MSRHIGKWILAGPADGLKTKIVMQSLMGNSAIQTRRFVLLCEADQGRAVDSAKRNGIEVISVQDPRFRTERSLSIIDEVGADMMVCCGWNYMVPPAILNRFPYPCLNCHGSLLPDYKGRRTYMHQWANCEERYGVTIHFMSEDLDGGRCLLQGSFVPFPNEDLVMVHRRLSEMTGTLLPQALLRVEQGHGGMDYDAGVASRYFHRITARRAKWHRFCNKSLARLGLPLWLTPHDKSALFE